jgi:hypothetical protein
LNRLLLLLAVALCAFIQLSAIAPPEPLPAAGSLDRFSAERAQRHLEVIAQRPHPIGSMDNARVRDYLRAELEALGFRTELQRTPVVYTYRKPKTAAFAFVENIIGVKRGTAGGGPALMLMSHYDSRLNAPGAGDDGAGTVAILETLRALQASPPLARDLVVLISDGEEAGLYGAQAFVQYHPLAPTIGLVLNLEARGSRGPALLFETSAGNAGLIAAVAESVPQPVSNALFYEAYKLMPNDTDLSVTKAAGLAGLNVALIGGFFDYHSPTDTPANFSPATLQHLGEYALALTREFGMRELPVTAEHDAAYFDLFGQVLVYYPQWLAHGLSLLALALVVTLLGRARGAELVTGVGVLRGFGAWLGVLALVALVATALFALTGFGADDAARYWWGIARLDWQVLAYATVAVGLTLMAAALYTRRWSGPELALGALLTWGLLTLGASLVVPSASAVFSLPLIGAALAQHAVFGRARSLATTLTLLLGAAWGFAFGAFLVQFVHLGLGYEMPGLPAAVAVLVLGLAVPVYADGTPFQREPIGPALLGAGIAVLLLIALTPPWSARHPRPADLFVIADLDADTSEFASSDADRDAWQLARVPVDAAEGSWSRVAPGYDAPLWTAPTPERVTVLAPGFEKLSDTTSDGLRRLRLRYLPPTGAIAGNLWFQSESVVEAVALVGVGALPVSPPADAIGLRRIRWNAIPATGVELEFTLRGDAPLTLRSHSLTPGYPAPYTALSAERLPDTMARHYGYGDSTVILASAKF